MRLSDLFNSDNYNAYMYVAISVVTLLLFFNSVSLVETGLQDFEFKGLTGYAVEDIESNDFDDYLNEFVEQDKIRRPRGLTGFAVEDVDEDTVSPEENIPEGELYTEGSFFLYYMLLAFIGLCIFILSAVFFLPKLKDLT